MGAGEDLRRRQEQRFTVLKHMYDTAASQAGDLRGAWFEADEITKELRYAKRDIVAALSYLEGKGLIEIALNEYENPTYIITHSGIEEIERSLTAPEQGTEHFTSQVIQHFYGAVGAVQTGPNATAHVNQNIGADLSSVFALIEQLRQQAAELPEEEQDEAQVTLDALDAELRNGKEPKKVRVFVKRLQALGQGAAAAVGFGANATTLATQAQTLGLF